VMSRTRLGNCALLVIDAQQGFLDGPPPAFEAARVVDVIAGLLRQARTRGVPVVFTQFDGPPKHPVETGTVGWTIHSELAPLRDEAVVRKHSTDSFHNTDLDDRLRTLNVRHLYVTGFVTELCVDTTCRRAMTLGYDVVLVADGHTTPDGTPQGLPEPAVRIHMTNHVLKSLAGGDCSIDVIPAERVDL
jgi:nicotinamidase-related amidase